ncbi:MAG: EAL domain-containing response regulator [Deltaproteobacteria bacterium]|nr:EAL domain-containing response regulator [Deltaproteobacteria bacterium]
MTTPTGDEPKRKTEAQGGVGELESTSWPVDSSPGPELRERLLIVEDDPEIGALIGRIAEKCGFETAISADFETLHGENLASYSVVILDLHLPRVDGVEIIRFLAAEECQAGLILVSGVDKRLIKAAEKIARERGLRVVGSLTKPFHPTELRKFLQASRRTSLPTPQTPIPQLSDEEVRRAVNEGAIDVHYQPKVHLSSRRVCGVEALARMNHPDLGLLTAGAFIAQVEKLGLIDELTQLVFERAFEDCGQWKKAGQEMGVSVNFSVQSLHHLALPDELTALALTHGVAPSQFTVEITESSLAQEPIRALDILTRFRLKGFGLSIDDFGTGYSTLQQLERIPFGELKLDRSFIRGAVEGTGARAILSSSVELAHKLEMRVVAEGVETQQDWVLAAQLGCDEVQGYLISRPMAREMLLPWLQGWHSES